ncbi:MAG: c-type cytochrome biogenesis protein CcmI, partial [Gammaproteobacteria bacterium]|nr:c-type cytochrome biogenesis protein CcmI [Gammaproteobacteria bacterium]
MIFGGLVVILILLALATLIIPVLKKPREDHRTNRTQQNIQIAKEKKNLLEEQLQQQQMTQEEYDAALKDLENSLAIDLERQQALADNRESGTWVVWLFALFVPVLSIYLYLQWGAYQVIENPTLAQARTSTNQAQNPHQSGETPSMDELIE